MQENLEDLFRYVSKWKPLSVGIESSGQQGGFLSIIREMMMAKNIWFTLAKKPGSKEIGIRPIKDKVHRFVTGVQPKFKQNKIWLPRPEITKGQNPNLWALVEEMVHELERFTLAGGVSALAHDDAIDLLNQLSEMEIYLPSSGEVDYSKDIIPVSGVWADIEEEDENTGGSTVF